MLGARRVVPLVIDETQTENLRRLLQQDELWVTRARWVRWLDHGRVEDACPITELDRASRHAAAAWVHQQRHTIHDAVEGGARAPDGWAESLPLYRALTAEV